MEFNSINDSSIFFNVVGVKVGVVRVGIPHVKPSILEQVTEVEDSSAPLAIDDKISATDKRSDKFFS